MQHQGTIPETLVASFAFNKSLQGAKLQWRFNERFTDSGWATAFIGAEILAQQERAETRYAAAAGQMRSAIDAQTQASAEQARLLRQTIADSSEVVRRGLAEASAATRKNTDAVEHLSSQVAYLGWLQAEQNATLRQIFELLREGRANECRQLVEQGERNFRAGYVAEAEERYRLALSFDNTDYVVHQNLGLTYVRLGRVDEALHHFEKALAFPPRTANAQRGFFVARAATHIARLLYARSDYVGAAAKLVTALASEPANAKNWYDLAVMLAYQRDGRKAADAIARAITVDPVLAGQALADPELEPVRPHVEDVVHRKTADSFRALEADAIRMQEHARRATELVSRIGISITVPPVTEVVQRAHEHRTYSAVREASSAIRRDEEALRIRVLGAVQQSRSVLDAAAQADAEKSQAAYDRFGITGETHAALRATAGARPNVLPQIVAWLVGAIGGTVLGSALGGSHTVIGGMLGFAFGQLGMLLLYQVLVLGRRRAANATLSRDAGTRRDWWTRRQAEDAERVRGRAAIVAELLQLAQQMGTSALAEGVQDR